MKRTADDLRTALALLERDGWRQGEFGPTDPGVREPRCALGACRAVTPTLDRSVSAGAALCRALSHTELDVTDYNDHPGRRFSAIKRLFERAIAAEEAS